MRTFTRVAALAVAASFVAGAAVAQDPIAARKAAMKLNGVNVLQLVKMSKGDEPYDAAKAKGAMDSLLKTAISYSELFPVGSDKGDTKANEKIWSDKAGFAAAVAKFKTAIESTSAGAAKDIDGVKAAIGAIGPTCNECHSVYRKS